MRIDFTEREAELMEVLWSCGPSTVSEVQSHVVDELAYTTVLSHLRALESKGHVSHTGEGRAHRYYALIERVDAQKSALQALLARLFKGSPDALLVHLVENEKLSPKQVQRIQDRLSKGTSKGRR